MEKELLGYCECCGIEIYEGGVFAKIDGNYFCDYCGGDDGESISELLLNAFNSYKELEELVQNTDKTLDELCKDLQGYNLEDDLFDLDYKELVATIMEKDGKLQVCKSFDIWNDKSGECWVGKSIESIKKHLQSLGVKI